MKRTLFINFTAVALILLAVSVLGPLVGAGPCPQC